MWRRVAPTRGRVVTVPGWKAIEQMFLSTLKQKTEKKKNREAAPCRRLPGARSFPGVKLLGA